MMPKPDWYDPELDAEEDPAVLREDDLGGLNEPPTKEQP